ncbi:hemolysin family protein [Corynebacterium mastitidis]|uniref:Hemolysin family protein n=1 Tax=Corynebacterium mastitidis TaxID=161890 RepID=A0ABU8NYQ7_9CORY
MSILTTVALIAALLLANAFFVASEFALISSRRDRVEALIAQGRAGAPRVLYATEHLSLMLAGAQFGITLCSLVLGKVAEPTVAHFVEEPFSALGVPANLIHPLSFVIALAIITFLHILFGEMVPKNIAIAGPETLALWLAPGIIGWVRLTRPLIELLNWIARITLRLFGIEQKDELDSTVDQKQLASMIAESRAEGYIDAEEHARLNKALRSENRSLKEVMIPLPQVRSLDFGRSGPTIADLERMVQDTGFSRFPVTGRDGSYLGYIHVKDVLGWMSSSSPDAVIPRSQLRPLIFVDGQEPLDHALHTLHLRSAHMAQVRDRGELIGIVALEDLIEEYVGTVTDWTHEEA